MYLLFGASIYYHIENKLEKEQRIQELKDRIEINGKCFDSLLDFPALLSVKGSYQATFDCELHCSVFLSGERRV